MQLAVLKFHNETHLTLLLLFNLFYHSPATHKNGVKNNFTESFQEMHKNQHSPGQAMIHKLLKTESNIFRTSSKGSTFW